MVGQLTGAQGEAAHVGEGVVAALPGAALVVGAGGCAEGVDGGAQQRGGFRVEGGGEAQPAVGLLGDGEVPVAGRPGGLGVECGAGGGVGDVGGDVVEDAGAELAQQHGVELPGPVDQHTDGLVGHLGPAVDCTVSRCRR